MNTRPPLITSLTSLPALGWLAQCPAPGSERENSPAHRDPAVREKLSVSSLNGCRLGLG